MEALPVDAEVAVRAAQPPRPHLRLVGAEEIDHGYIIDYPRAHKGVASLDHNQAAWSRQMKGEIPQHTSPSDRHYLHGFFPWDEAWHSKIRAALGTRESIDKAKQGFRAIFKLQEPDGRIFNFYQKGPKRRFDPEHWFGFESKEHSDYLEPPIFAMGAIEIDKAIRHQKGVDPTEAAQEADNFLREVYPGLKSYYQYLDQKRSNEPGDRRMFLIHPHETGWDGKYRDMKPHRLGRKGIETPWIRDFANRGLDYWGTVQFDRKFRETHGDLEAQKELFGRIDLWMNCALVDNDDEMGVIASHLAYVERDPKLKQQYLTDTVYFRQYARDVEQQILDKMWFPEARGGAGMFYDIDGHGQPVIDVGTTNLMPGLLPNLSIDQYESNLELKDRSFDVPYPLPSLGTDNDDYDPHYRQKGLFPHGPTWIEKNELSVRGDKKQMTRAEMARRIDLIARSYHWAGRVVTSSRALVEMYGPREFYNPITGKAQRRRVKNFGWSNLAHIMSMDDIDHYLEQNDMLEEVRARAA